MSNTPARSLQRLVPPVPAYLERHYWWAYVRPGAVRVFERQWLVSAILWGNFRRLRDAALERLGDPIRGRTLQVACVYGDLTARLLARHGPDARLDVVDVLPIQLENLGRKLAGSPGVSLAVADSTSLGVADGTYDQVLIFFLLHEQPLETRRRTLAEALRVTRPGGRIVLVDYHRPDPRNPLRLLMHPILRTLEPFALELWREELSAWLPDGGAGVGITKQTFFGGLYQLLELSVPPAESS